MVSLATSAFVQVSGRGPTVNCQVKYHFFSTLLNIFNTIFEVAQITVSYYHRVLSHNIPEYYSTLSQSTISYYFRFLSHTISEYFLIISQNTILLYCPRALSLSQSTIQYWIGLPREMEQSKFYLAVIHLYSSHSTLSHSIFVNYPKVYPILSLIGLTHE